jgi:hypothetical protein
MERRRSPFMAISGIFGAAWVLAAWLRPDANFVLFPLLLAGSLPVIYRLTVGGAIPWQIATAAAIAGLVNVVLLAAFLSIAGKLQGPPVIPMGGPVLDAIVWGMVGAAAGVAGASWRRPPGSS